MLDALIRHTSVLEIVGDIIRVRATDAALGDLAVVENTDGEVSSASVVELNREIASLQVFAGGKGISTSRSPSPTTSWAESSGARASPSMGSHP
jgi:V/A-type H+-transporting ATPase subunit B